MVDAEPAMRNRNVRSTGNSISSATSQVEPVPTVNRQPHAATADRLPEVRKPLAERWRIDARRIDQDAAFDQPLRLQPRERRLAALAQRGVRGEPVEQELAGPLPVDGGMVEVDVDPRSAAVDRSDRRLQSGGIIERESRRTARRIGELQRRRFGRGPAARLPLGIPLEPRSQ